MILIPDLSDIEKTATSNAERRVARLLRAVEGPRDSVAFYSVKLRSHEVKQQAEADFVVLWGDIVILIEVKGGGVAKHDGIGFSYAMVDTREPDQHVRQHYLNLGTTYWIEDSLAIGVRASVFAQQISGEMVTTGSRSLFVTARLLLN